MKKPTYPRTALFKRELELMKPRPVRVIPDGYCELTLIELVSPKTTGFILSVNCLQKIADEDVGRRVVTDLLERSTLKFLDDLDTSKSAPTDYGTALWDAYGPRTNRGRWFQHRLEIDGRKLDLDYRDDFKKVMVTLMPSDRPILGEASGLKRLPKKSLKRRKA